MTAVRPKKGLGQHFLTDLRAAQRIVDLLAPASDEIIREIGPGKGVLTHLLAALPHPLEAVEIDAEAVAYLQTTPLGPHIIHADALTHPSAPGASYVWIGNLPYHISSALLFRVLDERTHIRQAVFMVQREVAQRICSPPGNRTYGLLSALLGAYYTPRYAFTVPPGAFFPVPKVHSGVFTLERRADLPDVPFDKLRVVVRTAFNQRRKMLGNALRPVSTNIPEAFASLRAEALSPDDFVQLTRLLFP